jgi:uncharacterized membrane protein (UPF0182 family)
VGTGAALQDTLKQMQAIRIYYDFPDVDVDRYQTGGQIRQMMIAARELNVNKLPETSRNWINQRLIYTHGYGVTMNTANEFTAEGRPRFILSNMPAESSAPTFRLSVRRSTLDRKPAARLCRHQTEGVRFSARRIGQLHDL